MINFKNKNINFKYINVLVSFVNQLFIMFASNDEVFKYNNIKENINDTYNTNLRVYKIYKRKFYKFDFINIIKEFFECFFIRINYRISEFLIESNIKKLIVGSFYLSFIKIIDLLKIFNFYNVFYESVKINKRLKRVNKRFFYRYINNIILNIHNIVIKTKYARFIRYKIVSAVSIFIFIYIILNVLKYLLNDTFIYHGFVVFNNIFFFVGVVFITLSKYSKEKLVIYDLKLNIKSKIIMILIMFALYFILNSIADKSFMELSFLNVLSSLFEMIFVILFYSTVVEIFFRRVLLDSFVGYIGNYSVMLSCFLFGLFMADETLLDLLLYMGVGYTFCILKKNGLSMLWLIFINAGVYSLSNIIFPIEGFTENFYIYYALTIMHVILFNICLVFLLRHKNIIKYKV